MHYQIYRFRVYLLVLLGVLENFGVKIYPNMLFVCCSQFLQHFPFQDLPNLQQASILGESYAGPCPKLQI